MKRNYTLNLCSGICFGIVLAIFPVKNNSATVTNVNHQQSLTKSEKVTVQENIEILHSDLLFR